MKKQTFITTLLVIATGMMFTNCEGKKQPKMSPQSTELSGDLKGYFEVVDKEITAGEDSWSIWNIELKRTNKPFPWDEDVTMANFNDFYSDGRAYCTVGWMRKRRKERNSPSRLRLPLKWWQRNRAKQPPRTTGTRCWIRMRTMSTNMWPA